MNSKPLLIALLAAGILGAAGYGLYSVGMQRGMDMSAAPTGAAAAGSVAGTEAVPQTIAQGEEATRRHIATGIKAGDVDPVTGQNEAKSSWVVHHGGYIYGCSIYKAP